jgi:hypothetical protein
MPTLIKGALLTGVGSNELLGARGTLPLANAAVDVPASRAREVHRRSERTCRNARPL